MWKECGIHEDAVGKRWRKKKIKKRSGKPVRNCSKVINIQAFQKKPSNKGKIELSPYPQD